jgi:SAM-dependent methyltransferase
MNALPFIVLVSVGGMQRDTKRAGTRFGGERRLDMESRAQTWHYGLIARWWAEFNDDFRPHEIPYFQRFIERGGQPALDVACGTGRLLVPYLRAGLDVDGCDVSADMVALCREKAARDGLSPTLFVQPMHELDPPRSYKTIFVCGAFGLGSIREQDIEALMRFHKYLEPGGTLLLDIEVPYADTRLWRYWLREDRDTLPEPPEPPRERRRASDGAEYALRSRGCAARSTRAARDPRDARRDVA